MATTTQKPSGKTAVTGAKKSPTTAAPRKSPIRRTGKSTQVAEKPKSAVLAKPKSKPKAEKVIKVKKAKLVRDRFNIPKTEYAVLEELKQRAETLAHPVKKSELVRAGVKALAAMSEAAFRSALEALPTITAKKR
ncbi:hypothetical protein [Polaromonas sp.]|uniref:hypothetical protein n=1 Tax=Polaromonas sp. TaxID=1869339 RepID=UPI002488DB98|nr:hypothetical protein [Polaromonas sp.]MDI1341487.1 hypothetical protein [Polaromonas sp.]